MMYKVELRRSARAGGLHSDTTRWDAGVRLSILDGDAYWNLAGFDGAQQTMLALAQKPDDTSDVIQGEPGLASDLRFLIAAVLEPFDVVQQVDRTMLRRAMGLPDEFRLEHGSRRDRIRLLGNGVCPPVMHAIVESLTRAELAAVGETQLEANLGNEEVRLYASS